MLFNIVINTPKGVLYVGKFSRKRGDEVVGRATSKSPTYNIKKAHELLGHNNENDTRQMASHLGWTITRGPLGVCESCANTKARQKNVPKISRHTVLKFCLQSVLQNVLIFSCFPANFCCAEHVNG